MKIALAQLNPIIGNLSFNSQKIQEAASQAHSAGARLLLTPELSLCGYPPRDLLLKPAFIQAMSECLQELALKLPREMAVLVGIATINAHAYSEGEKTLYNSSALLEEGKVKQYFHKRLLPSYDVFDEHRYFTPGKVSEYLDLDGVKIGVTICEDLWNDESFWGKKSYYVNPIEELASLDIDLIINLSASPYTVDKHSFRQAMLQYTAKEYHLPIIYTNQIGGNDDLIFDGHSIAINKQGETILQAKGFQESIEIVEYDQEKQDITKGNIAILAQTAEEEIWTALVLGVKDYALKCGFTKAILGLSGGIDSALVAAIAVEAFGAENVLGLLMPSPYSSAHSVTDAQKLVKILGMQSSILPIGDVMKDYDTILANLFQDTAFGIAQENIQSRIRGNLLMAVANKFGHLLLSTGNKSEMAVGYCTLYGDMNGGLAVIADLPKTRVYALCTWLNRHQEHIPHNILIKPPSAELKPGQLDQDSLPAYEILDDILQKLLNEYQSQAEIIAAGHDAKVVSRVMNLVFKAEFKRKQAPPCLKITDRAFGTGWRMPIASSW